MLTAKNEVLYVLLGKGQASRYGIGQEGVLLDVAARNRLPVPTGIILLDEAWRRARQSGLLRQEGERWLAPDPTALIIGLRLPNFRWELTGPFEVRSLPTPAEPSAGQAVAAPLNEPGVSTQDVSGLDNAQLAQALCVAWATPATDLALRRDVLIMRMVQAQKAGTALLDANSEDDLVRISFPPGPATLTQTLRLAHGRRTSPSTQPWAAWLPRLERLLADARRLYMRRRMPQRWELRWADDGARIWLLSVRPLATPEGSAAS